VFDRPAHRIAITKRSLGRGISRRHEHPSQSAREDISIQLRNRVDDGVTPSRLVQTPHKRISLQASIPSCTGRIPLQLGNRAHSGVTPSSLGLRYRQEGQPFSWPRSVAHSPDDRTSSDVDHPVGGNSAIDRMMRASTSAMGHRVGPLEKMSHQLMREGRPLWMHRAARGAIIKV
jgi:hypothetical protein